MALNPRFWQPIAIAVVACHHGAAAPVSEPARCGPMVPSTAQHPLATPPSALAGDYDLIQVRTQPNAGETSSGRLHLMPLDSTAKAAALGGAARQLIGWLDQASGDTAWRANVGSRDPEHPGVLLT